MGEGERDGEYKDRRTLCNEKLKNGANSTNDRMAFGKAGAGQNTDELGAQTGL